MSPEIIAKIKKWLTSGFAILLVVVGVFKPDWVPDAQAAIGNLTVGIDAILQAIGAILLLFSSGNLAAKNVL
jgi:hypothetical protein